MNIKKFLISSAAGALMLAASMAPAFASTSVIYNNIPNPLPGNVPSQAFEANSASEYGGQIQFAGTDRTNPTVTILMSSWGCQSGTWYGGDCVSASGATFTYPITLNVYNVNTDNSVGSLINTQTQTFTMPYRPSADNTHCTGDDAHKWFDGTKCNNGKAFTISYSLTGVTLPDKVIVSVAYNTSDYGANPIGSAPACHSTAQGCPYDSLNVGTSPTPTVGTALPTVNDAYLNSSWSGAYCVSNQTTGIGTFRLDTGCWTGYLPSIKVEAQPALVLPPVSKDQCKHKGWKTFNNPTFNSQDKCENYVEDHKVKPGKAEGEIRMKDPKQKIEFEVTDKVSGSDKGHVEYWNYDEPGVLHFKAKALCVFVDKLTKESRFMFQIPSGHQGSSGYYVVAYVKDNGHPVTGDLYGHNATLNSATAQTWCETGNGFSPINYPITGGYLNVH